MELLTRLQPAGVFSRDLNGRPGAPHEPWPFGVGCPWRCASVIARAHMRIAGVERSEFGNLQADEEVQRLVDRLVEVAPT